MCCWALLLHEVMLWPMTPRFSQQCPCMLLRPSSPDALSTTSVLPQSYSSSPCHLLSPWQIGKCLVCILLISCRGDKIFTLVGVVHSNTLHIHEMRCMPHTVAWLPGAPGKLQPSFYKWSDNDTSVCVDSSTDRNVDWCTIS